MTYRERIRQDTGCNAPDARLVEAWMRLERGTLDSLDRPTFCYEAVVGIQCVMADRDGSEQLAQSLGVK